MSQKREMVRMALQKEAIIAAIARTFHVQRSVVYRYRERYRRFGDAGLQERSRRPASSPKQTERATEQLVLELRDETHWGARKIAKRLRDTGKAKLHKSTVHSILTRYRRIDPIDSQSHEPWQFFEHPYPNDLWQMDFTGWITTDSGRCHPLTLLDDHSRFSLGLRACSNETTDTVQRCLTGIFDRYGLPKAMTMDNGSPWGDEGGPRLTKLTAWMVRLGIRVSHSRPYHPQTQGKDERFHATMVAELLRWSHFRDLIEAQAAFDRWRDRYNLERPHESLGMATPVTRYQPSTRRMPSSLPPIEYAAGDEVRKVDNNGRISFRGRLIRVGKGCSVLPVAIRPTTEDGVFDVYFCHQRIAKIDFNDR